MKLVQLLLPTPLEKLFTYQFDPSKVPLKLYDIVKVHFGKREVYALVMNFVENTPLDFQIKEVSEQSQFSLSSQHVQFLKTVSKYNMIPLGIILKMALSVPSLLTLNLIKNNVKVVPNYENVVLNETQLKAYEHLRSYCLQSYNCVVFQGVTGSGKTEVYLKVIQELCQLGYQCLVLLPEIFLTKHLIPRFAKRMNTKIVEWHSNLTPKVRKENWLSIYNGDASIVVGARSALFLPYSNLKLIVVDEEHESSFKQEDGTYYNARDMAVLRANIENIPVILSSATPSIESVENIISGKYKHVQLANRYGDAFLPEIKLIDMNTQKLEKNKWLSSVLKEALLKNLNQGKQALLYLNRRGYNALLICQNCSHKVSCPDCDFYLVQHKFKNKLLCHYCGYWQAILPTCKECSSQLYEIGPGVERLQEELKEYLPQARIAIFSSDTLSSTKESSKAIEAILNHKIDIIIGTQIVGKGLHFPKLELVGVIDADTNLYSGDLRAFEKTYQIITQVAGRAGRESDQGIVYIQTLEPDSYLMKCILNGEWENFVKYELHNRKTSKMPPYSRMAIIHFNSANKDLLELTMLRLKVAKPFLDSVKFLGPAKAPMFMRRKRYRYRFIVIADKNVNLQNIIRTWLNSIQIHPNIDIRIDIDPISFS